MPAETPDSRASIFSAKLLALHAWLSCVWLLVTMLGFYLHEQAANLLGGGNAANFAGHLASWRWACSAIMLILMLSLLLHYHLSVGRRLIRPLNQLQKKLHSSGTAAQTLKRDGRDPVCNLHSLIDTLEQQVVLMREQQQSMADAISDAEKANSAKSEFLANMSHEIRTPLTAILGHLHLLSASSLNDSQQRNVQRIATAAKILLDVINDILDFSRIESGKLQLESVNFEMSMVLANLQAMLELQAKSKGLTLSIASDEAAGLLLLGDPLRLSQVLLNLANNAIKFTEQGHVQLSLDVAPAGKNNTRLHFTVSDTGIGMSQDHIARLFQTFSQADSSTTRRFGGSGLGLAICQQLVELMGGSISVKSIPGEGSSFSFAIVLENGNPADTLIADELQPASANALAGMHILLVEDNALLMEYQSELLQTRGARVTCVADGLAAVEQLLGPGRFDAVLMDIQMPRMDGLTATREIRKRFRPEQLPIIAMTAHTQPDEIGKSLDAGMNAHLCKPVDSHLLVATLLKFCHVPPTGADELLPAKPAQHSPDDLPVSMQHFDLAAALACMGGKPSLLRKLLLRMQKEYRNSSEQLLALLSDGDYPAALRLAHSLKGVAATLGANDLQAAAQALESALREQSVENHAALGSQVSAQLALCIAELDQVFAANPERRQENMTEPPPSHEDLEDLISLLKQRNIKANRLFIELKPQLCQYFPREISDIDKAMQYLDFGRALNLLQPLKKSLSQDLA